MEHSKGSDFSLMLMECREACMFELATMIFRHQWPSVGMGQAIWPHYNIIVFNQDLSKWNTAKGLIFFNAQGVS